MPTFQNPTADAAEASEALRGLAHAARVFEDPADTYAVLGDLLAGVRSLRQVLDQLASAHVRNQVRAYDDAGNQGAGASHALAAAADLRHAAVLLDGVHDQVDAAMGGSGRIAWRPAPSTPAPPGRGLGRVSLPGRDAAAVPLDRVVEQGGYLLTYNHDHGHVSLLRTHPEARELDTPQAKAKTAAPSRARRTVPSIEEEDDWFAPSQSSSPSRGRAL